MLTLEDIIESVRKDVQIRLQGIDLHESTVIEIISFVTVGYVPNCHQILFNIAKQNPYVANWSCMDEPEFWDNTPINMIKSSIFEIVHEGVCEWYINQKEK